MQEAGDASRGSLKYPFTWMDLADEDREDRRALFSHPMSTCAGGDDCVRSRPAGLVFPAGIRDIAEEIYRMEVRPDDVWVVTYPKCGTTWTQEMVWQIRRGFDPAGGAVDIDERFPHVELEMFVPPPAGADDDGSGRRRRVLEAVGRTVKAAKEMSSPRCIKTHLPVSMLPPALLDTCKVVFVSRNPKDCCVSYYHHERLIPFQGYTGDFASYAGLFTRGKVIYGDYWYHLEHAWKNRDHPNAMLIWYEEMKADLDAVIRRAADHLECALSEETISTLEEHLRFDNFKKNPAVNNSDLTNHETGETFIRKGVVGDYANYFTEKMVADWDEWIEDKKKEHGIEHKFVV